MPKEMNLKREEEQMRKKLTAAVLALALILGMIPGASAAELAVMQFQDLLGLGSEARMNIPSTLGTNWRWRTLPGTYNETLSRRLRRETQIYQRLPQAKKSKK